MITGTYAGTHAIVPAALLSNNFEITYGLGTLTILPKTLTVDADDKSGVYGDVISFTSSVNGFGYDDNLSGISNGLIQYQVKDISQQILNFPYPVGSHKIIPGSLGLILPTDYVVNYTSGDLNISKATLYITADNKTRVYGDPNPAFTLTYSGFVNGENETFITPPSISCSATSTSNIGNYNITLSGGSANNYTLDRKNGTLTITKASLLVVADNKWIYKGNSLPAFTSTITGWKNNEQTTITSGPTYSTPAGCNQAAGVYPITVCCLNFPKKTNYNITYQSGLLYINPKGNGAKKIKPSLICV
jgi:hypothetical protein